MAGAAVLVSEERLDLGCIVKIVINKGEAERHQQED